MADGVVEGLEDRVLVLAPTARDGAATRDLLAGAGVRCMPCGTIEEICLEAARGAGAVVVTAEAVIASEGEQLASLLAAQPRWSDLPVVVLTPLGPDSPRLLKALEVVGRVTLMKRPVQVASLVSSVRAALRDRKRQYEVRDFLIEREQAAETLRAERERYRVTLSSIGDAVIATDASGDVTFVNPMAESLTGWSPGLASGRPLAEVFCIVHEATRQKVENPALRALDHGAVIGLANHTVLVSKDGTERPIDDSAAPIRAEDGTVTGAVLVFRDITERRKGEEVRARLAAIVESSDDVIIGKTLNGVIQYWNAGAERVFGYSAAEAVGQSISLIIPQDRLDEERDILDRLRRGERINHFETVRCAKGGRPVDVSVTISPIRDAAGRVIGASKIARDVTERKRAAEELARVTAESERRKRLYEAILSSTPDFVYVFGLDHRVMYANDALLEVWGRGRAIGKTFLEIGYEAWHAELHEREIDQVRKTKQPIRGEVPFTGTHGRRIYDYIFVPVFGADGEVEAVAGTTRDVTERKAMEETLREADRKKDDFIALLAHELRNPLAPLRNGLQVICLSKDPEARERSQAMMERQLSHMVRMIDDLLDVARISRNKMELRRERVTLADVIANAVETARPTVDDFGHDLILSVPSEPIHLNADVTRLAQVFSNLLTNSAKYTPHGGQIWLNASRTATGVSVSVRDTGIGIPDEALGSVFDMFSQVDRVFERNSGGLGIGLALVKGLVDMHNGTVTAQSPGPGQGSTFTVTLPTIDGSPVVSTIPKTIRSPSRPAWRVLVVDDNSDAAESMAEMLRLLGDDVRTANDGMQAVAEAGAFRPQIILMDVGMPRLNGLDATRRIREQGWGKEIVILALTGWGQEKDRIQSCEAGCDGHLVKPVSLSELENVLKDLARRRTETLTSSPPLG